MNRTIKFRAWDGTKYLFSDLNPFEQYAALIDDDLSQDRTDANNGCLLLKPIPNLASLIWEQFTGLVDSQGVDIYEGDILLGSEARFEETLVSDPDDDLNFPVYEVHTDKPLPAPDVPFFRAVVTWNQSFCAFHLTYLWRRPDWGEAASTNLLDISYTYTVIGNIHENNFDQPPHSVAENL